MTVREDLSRVALGAATLHEVFIVSVPDCLLVKTWSRAPRDGGDTIGTHLGRVHSIARELLEALGARGTNTSVTLETEDALVILNGVARGLIAGLVFDRAAPLGLARLQSAELVEQIRATLKSPAMPPSAPVPAAPPPQPAPAPRRAPAADDLTELPQPRFGTDAVRTSPRMPRVELDPPPPPESIAPTVAPPPSSPAPAPQTAAPRRTPPPAQSSPGAALPPGPAGRTRAARLIEILRQSAPDPHTALLRLSLRTGIAVDALERPETLTDQHADAIAVSVRDLLGREVAV